MVKMKAYADSTDADEDASYGSLRPAPLRGRRKSKSSSRSRKSRSKSAGAPGGIHQRANKRMTW
jgi:hypothetical protein